MREDVYIGPLIESEEGSVGSLIKKILVYSFILQLNWTDFEKKNFA